MNLVFHMSLLKKCIGVRTSIVSLKSKGVKDSLSYEEVPIENLYCHVCELRN